jgi:hypothetical protein
MSRIKIAFKGLNKTAASKSNVTVDPTVIDQLRGMVKKVVGKYPGIKGIDKDPCFQYEIDEDIPGIVWGLDVK